jgi:hypothetical protein
MIPHPRHIAMLGLLLISPLTATAATQPDTIDLRVDRAPLFTLIERIARQCDAGLAVDGALGDTMRREITLNAKDAPWKDALALLESEYGIALALDDGRLVVTDADAEFRKKLVQRTYDVRSLTKPLENYPGPNLDIPEAGGQGAKLLPPIEPESAPEASDLVDTLQKHVRPESWTRAGVAIEEYSGAMVVTQTPEIQTEVQAFLERLERTAAREVVCRAWRIAAPHDANAPVADAATWARWAKDAGTPIASFVMIDGQQNHHFSGTQMMYIADANVVQGVDDPIVTVLRSGLGIDVEPQATLDGVIATIRFTATVDQQWTQAPVLDPAGRPLITVALPRTLLDTSRDSRLVPKGGAAVLRFGDRAYALTFEVLDWPAEPARP